MNRLGPSYFGSIVRCLVFSLVFGLIPLWAPVAFYRWRDGDNKLWALAALGILIFYGWGLCLQVVSERWGELYAILERRRRVSMRAAKELLVEVTLPIIVLVLSITASVVLIESGGPNQRIVLPQLVGAFFGFGVSLYQSLRVTWLLRKGRKHA